MLDDPRVSVRLRFRGDVELTPSPSARSFFVKVPEMGRAYPIDVAINPALIAWLTAPGVSEEELLERAAGNGGVQAVAETLLALRRLTSADLLRHELRLGKKPYLEAAPLQADFRLIAEPCDRQCVGPLSRFALVRRDGEHLVVESPDAHARVVCLSPAPVAVIGALAKARSVAQIAASSGVAQAIVIGVVGTLESAQLLDSPDRSEAASAWEFHDRLFHARTRHGYFHDLLGLRQPPHPQPEHSDLTPTAAARIVLPPPEIPSAGSASLIDALDRRQSVRAPGPNCLGIDSLSTFLHRCLRGRSTPSGIRRPYPCPGGLDALRFYLWVARCEGLAPGFYRYDPGGHELAHLSADQGSLRRAMRRSAVAMGIGDATPDVVIVIASLHEALTARYRGIAYRLGLMTVGAVQQTMYLIAAGMGLAPCAIGTGDSGSLGATTGLVGRGETTVGEFALSAGPAAD